MENEGSEESNRGVATVSNAEPFTLLLGVRFWGWRLGCSDGGC